jgi:pimeloyl-ACP methyl ester carboxylesterase
MNPMNHSAARHPRSRFSTPFATVLAPAFARPFSLSLAVCLTLVASVSAIAQQAPARPGAKPPAAQPGAQPGGQPPAAQPGAKPVAQPGAKPGAKPAAGQPGAKPAAKKPERPAPRTVELVTMDGVKLRAFYFPSDKGKEAVPVIVVHEWQGQASPYAPLVNALWEAGCAVIVPELRGHGASKTQEIGGRKQDFVISRMGKADVANMITGDLETVKKFLAEENNAGLLNLNALTLIGIREGAVIAAHWAVRDLNFPSVGAVKQGQDVKAMVLISPERTVKGFSLDDALKDRFLPQLPFLVVVGQSSRQAPDAEKFQKKLELLKVRAARGEASDLSYEALATSLEGPALVNDVPAVIPKVKAFVVSKVVANAGRIPWVERP